MPSFYPWGLSLDLGQPLGPARTRLRYRAWVWDAARRDRGTGAGDGLHEVEHEDDAIVESAQRGVTSRRFGRARYSPARETGVHHFHRLLARLLV